jgi:hypothetical protein
MEREALGCEEMTVLGMATHDGNEFAALETPERESRLDLAVVRDDLEDIAVTLQRHGLEAVLLEDSEQAFRQRGHGRLSFSSVRIRADGEVGNRPDGQGAKTEWQTDSTVRAS